MRLSRHWRSNQSDGPHEGDEVLRTRLLDGHLVRMALLEVASEHCAQHRRDERDVLNENFPITAYERTYALVRVDVAALHDEGDVV